MANIKRYLDNIKSAILGKDVRNSIHDAIEAMNNETNENTVKQNLLERLYDEQIKELANSQPQLPEIVDARMGFDTLGSVIKQKVYHFENVDEMKRCLTLFPGDVVKTLGYYSANDGGGADYLVRIKRQDDVDDGGSVHFINNNLVAELLKNIYNFFEITAKTFKTISNDLIIRNTFFKGNGNVFVIQGQANRVKFIDCIFDNFNLQIYSECEYDFVNCEFINCSTSSIHISADNSVINILNTKFLNARPNKTEWNENASSVRFWKFCPINVFGSNNKLYVKNSIFNNIMAGHFIFSPSASENNYIEILNNYFNTIEGNGITFQNSVKGKINNNTFENIGLLRETEGYETVDTNKGVGCNAIFCPKVNQLDIINNKIVNCVENGIEGIFENVIGNYIENTGCRYNEGYTTPSTEGIWGYAQNISDNTIINPYTHGIVLSSAQQQANFSILVQNNKCLSNQNLNYGIYLNFFNINKNIVVNNNTINGFSKKYHILNTESITADNVLINDIIQENQRDKIILDVFDHLRGVQFNSNIMEKIQWENIYFKNATDNIPNNWTKSNCTFTQEIDNNEKFGKIITNDEYGRIGNSDIQLPTNYYSLICLHLIAKSSSDMAINVLCKNDSGNTYPSADGGVYSNYKITIPKSENYKDYYVTIKAIGLTKIHLFGTQANQEIDVKCFEGWKIN